MRLLFVLLVCCGSVAAAVQTPVSGGLTVVVIDGDEAASIVAERMAAEPVVEVRDRENRRVSGAVVRFVVRRTLRDRLASAFRNGETEVRTLTDATGRARAGTLTPLEPGPVEIQVEVSYQGETATATIRQTNFATVTEARSAGREPARGQSSASAGQGAAAAGGGVSKLLVIAATAGAGTVAGAAVLASRERTVPIPTGSIAAVIPSASSGVQAGTTFAFSVETTNFDSRSVTYRWEFGDGGTSSDPAPTYVYALAGAYTVSVTVSDARQSSQSSTTVTVYTLTGTWFESGGGLQTLQISQTDRTISGEATVPFGAAPAWTGCVLSGSVGTTNPMIVIDRLPGCPHPVFPLTPLVPAQYRLNLSSDGQTLSGTYRQVTTEVPILLRR